MCLSTIVHYSNLRVSSSNYYCDAHCSGPVMEATLLIKALLASTAAGVVSWTRKTEHCRERGSRTVGVEVVVVV